MLKAAIIGLGVGEQHIAGLERHPACRVVALCDKDPAKLAEVGGRHPGRQMVGDASSVLEDPEIDVVSVASYDDDHRDHVVAALRNGKHVFVEKPLCLTAEELDDIVRALRAHPDRKLSSNLILRLTPRFAEMRRRVAEGRLGRLYLVEGDYNYGRLSKITEGWRGRLPYYSVMIGGGIHLVDLLCWLSGRRVVEVSAVGTRIATRGTGFRYNDTVVALLTFDDGMIGKVAANFACVLPHSHRVALYGTEATFTHGLEGARFHTSRTPSAEPEAITSAYPGTGKGDLLHGFVEAIVTGTEPPVSAAEVVEAMAVCLAIERAMTTGATQPVVVPQLRVPLPPPLPNPTAEKS